jgi:hypothetical protein
MEKDFTFIDVDSLVEFVSLSDRAEHEGYLGELEGLDFSQEEKAREAIRKWLVPIFEATRGRTPVGRQRVMVALQVAMSRWGFMPYVSDLPGIDEERPPYRPMQQTFDLKRRFYAWLWDELFHEPFVRLASTDDLRERSDDAFVNAPNNPELWGTPRYRSLTHWDELLRTDAWRENWPPKEG